MTSYKHVTSLRYHAGMTSKYKWSHFQPLHNKFKAISMYTSPNTELFLMVVIN
jgi:hypothetical protein